MTIVSFLVSNLKIKALVILHLRSCCVQLNCRHTTKLPKVEDLNRYIFAGEGGTQAGGGGEGSAL